MSLSKKHTVFLIRSYNEATRIVSVVQSVFDAGYDQILIVDDGSRDDTWALLSHWIRSDRIHYVRHPINRGGGAALETGFEYVRRYADQYSWRYVVTFDADGQMDIADMRHFESAFQSNPDLQVAVGSRVLEGSVIEHMPWYRRWIVLVGGPLFTRMISGRTPSDPHNGYRMLRLDVVRQIHLTMDGFAYSSELIDEMAQGGYIWQDIPVRIRYDDYTLGKGQKASNAINIAIRMIYKKFF